LRRLSTEQQGAILSVWRRPPESAAPPIYRIRLAAWATDVGRCLVDRFGADVEVIVGHFAFPNALATTNLFPPLDRTSRPRLPFASSAEIDISLVSTIEIASGHDGDGLINVRNRG
jgi:hypothetical protein